MRLGESGGGTSAEARERLPFGKDCFEEVVMRIPVDEGWARIMNADSSGNQRALKASHPGGDLPLPFFPFQPHLFDLRLRSGPGGQPRHLEAHVVIVDDAGPSGVLVYAHLAD